MILNIPKWGNYARIIIIIIIMTKVMFIMRTWEEGRDFFSRHRTIGPQRAWPDHVPHEKEECLVSRPQEVLAIDCHLMENVSRLSSAITALPRAASRALDETHHDVSVSVQVANEFFQTPETACEAAQDEPARAAVNPYRDANAKKSAANGRKPSLATGAPCGMVSTFQFLLQVFQRHPKKTGNRENESPKGQRARVIPAHSPRWTKVTFRSS